MQPEAEHTFCVWIHLLDESAVNGYSFSRYFGTTRSPGMLVQLDTLYKRYITFQVSAHDCFNFCVCLYAWFTSTCS